MVEWRTAPVSPSLATPSKNEASHPMNQKLGIGVELNLCSARNRAQSFDSCEKLHLRDHDPGKCARHLPPFARTPAVTEVLLIVTH
jgi:hypothetical protein